MTWTLFRWVWRLEAPLFIGMPPAGSLNRCRLYVPARAMHGAVTAELARMNGDEKAQFPDYGKFGKEVGENCRFTYLYPAEKCKNNFLPWLPKYVQNRNAAHKTGLRWHRVDGKADESDRDFRRRLLDSRHGTAIAPESDSASEGTLRETECINTCWRYSDCQKEANVLFLLGYIFLRNNGFRRQLDTIGTLFVGGDTRYGLGKIQRVEWQEVSVDVSVFGKQVRLDREHPQIESDIVWGHALGNDNSDIDGMDGIKEYLVGWEPDGLSQKGALAWAPGSSLERPVAWSIDNYGYWMHQGKG